MERMSTTYVGSYTTVAPSKTIEGCEGGTCDNGLCFPTFPNNKFFGNPYTWLFLFFSIIAIIFMIWLINSEYGQKSAWYTSMRAPWPFNVTWMLTFLIVLMGILFWLACSFGSSTEPRISCVTWGFFLIFIVLIFWCMSFFFKHMFGLSMAFLVLGILILFWLGWVFGVSNGFKITALILMCVFALFWLVLVYYNAGFWWMNPAHNGTP